MGSLIKETAIWTCAFVALAGGSARAATIEEKVPFPFLVRGQTLPAGQYRFELDRDSSVILIRGEHGNKATAFVMTMPASGQDSAGDKPALTFKRHETQYRLADIWDSDHQGREIAGS